MLHIRHQASKQHPTWKLCCRCVCLSRVLVLQLRSCIAISLPPSHWFGKPCTTLEQEVVQMMGVSRSGTGPASHHTVYLPSKQNTTHQDAPHMPHMLAKTDFTPLPGLCSFPELANPGMAPRPKLNTWDAMQHQADHSVLARLCPQRIAAASCRPHTQLTSRTAAVAQRQQPLMLMHKWTSRQLSTKSQPPCTSPFGGYGNKCRSINSCAQPCCDRRRPWLHQTNTHPSTPPKLVRPLAPACRQTLHALWLVNQAQLLQLPLEHSFRISPSTGLAVQSISLRPLQHAALDTNCCRCAC